MNMVSTMGGLPAEPIYASLRGCHQFAISWRLGRQLQAPDSTILMKALALLETALNKDGSLIRLSQQRDIQALVWGCQLTSGRAGNFLGL